MVATHTRHTAHTHRLLPLLPSGPDGVHNLTLRGDRHRLPLTVQRAPLFKRRARYYLLIGSDFSRLDPVTGFGKRALGTFDMNYPGNPNGIE